MSKLSNNGLKKQSKQQQEQQEHVQNLKSCLKFKIRPPIFTQPVIKINQCFSTFSVKVGNHEIQKIKCNVPIFNENTQQFNKNNPNTNNSYGNKIFTNSLAEKDKIQFLKNKTTNPHKLPHKINLFNYNLHKILTHFFQQRFMLYIYYQRFNKNYNQKVQQRLIEVGNQNSIKKYMKQNLFILYDHRIFAEILVREYGDTFYINTLNQNININMDQNKNNNTNTNIKNKSKNNISNSVNKYSNAHSNKNNKNNQLQMFKDMYGKKFDIYLKQWDEFNVKYGRTWMPKSNNFMDNPYFFRQLHDF